MKIILLLWVCYGILIPAFAQDKPAYVLYSAKGRKVSYKM